MPAHMEIYEDGLMELPLKLKCYHCENYVYGTIGGISELTLIHSSMYFAATSMTEGITQAGRYEFNNIYVMAGGTLELTEDIMSELTLSDGALHVAPSGTIKAKRLTVTGDTITVEEGGIFDLDETGFGTDGPGEYTCILYGPRCYKIRGFRKSKTQTVSSATETSLKIEISLVAS